MERVPLTYGHVAAACGGRLIRADEARPIEGISIDSRTLAAGDLFVAIRGDRFDGHRFLADAFARGASGAVIDARAAGCGSTGASAWWTTGGSRRW